MIAEPDRVPGVLPPEDNRSLLLEVPEHRTVDLGAGDARTESAKATAWAATAWSNSRRISSVGGPIIIARSSSAL